MSIRSFEICAYPETGSAGAIGGHAILTLIDPKTGQESTLHLKVNAADGASLDAESCQRLLQEDALRQLRRMPEYRRHVSVHSQAKQSLPMQERQGNSG